MEKKFKAGRKPVLNQTQKNLIINQYQNGKSVNDLASQFQVSVSTIRKCIKQIPKVTSEPDPIPSYIYPDGFPEDNAICSDCIQMLLDMQALGIDTSYLFDKVIENPELLAKIDHRYRLHSYNQVKFSLAPKSSGNAIFHCLSKDAADLLRFYMSSINSEKHNVFRHRNYDIDFVEWNPCKLAAARKELMIKGCIVEGWKTKDNGVAGELFINPEIAYVGMNKTNEIKKFWKKVNNPTIYKTFRYLVDNYNDYDESYL